MAQPPTVNNFAEHNHGFQQGQNFGQTHVHIPPERPETPPKPFFNAPFHRDPNFVKRPALTEQIHSKLHAPAGRAALVGLGGTGKTQLAIEYARTLREQSPQTWVLWIHASNEARFEHSVRDVADQLKLSGRRNPRADHLQLLHSWLCDESKGRWLVILDNADDATFLLEPSASPDDSRPARRRIYYFPSCDHGSMIITSRSKTEALKLVYEPEMVAIRPMSEDEAVALLDSKLEQSGADNRHLARALDCMPLAITQAAAYIRERTPRCSVQQYLEEMEQSRLSRTSLLKRDAPLPGRDPEASNSVLLTWQISFEHLFEMRRSAADLLSLMSLCDRLAIPETLLRADDDDSSASSDGTSIFEDDIVALRSFSFVSPTTDPKTWEMHRLVQDATQLWLEKHGRLLNSRNRFVHCLYNSVPEANFENWPVCRVLFPHAKSAAEQRPVDRDALLEWAWVLYRSAWYADEQGNLTDALAMAEASMEVRVTHLGQNEEPTLWSFAMIALVYRKQGRLDDAEKLQVQVMETRRTVFGPKHPDTLVGMHELAMTYERQERLDDAEKLQVQVMETMMTVLGPKHPDTLSSMNNLASTYENQGRLDDAEKLQVQVIETRTAVLGPKHLDTLKTINNLVLTYWGQERWKEAEELQVKALETQTMILGPEHPDRLVLMGNLAVAYSAQQRWREAEELQTEMVHGMKMLYGLQDSRTLGAISDLEYIRDMRSQAPSNDAQDGASNSSAQRSNQHHNGSNAADEPTRHKHRWRWWKKEHGKGRAG